MAMIEFEDHERAAPMPRWLDRLMTGAAYVIGAMLVLYALVGGIRALVG